jgi:hypothetical protein
MELIVNQKKSYKCRIIKENIKQEKIHMPTHHKIKAKIHKDFTQLYNTQINNLHLITNNIIKCQIKKVANKLEECKIIK